MRAGLNASEPTSEFELLEAIGGNVHLQVDVNSVGNKDSVIDRGKTLLVELLELLEEARAKDSQSASRSRAAKVIRSNTNVVLREIHAGVNGY